MQLSSLISPVANLMSHHSCGFSHVVSLPSHHLSHITSLATLMWHLPGDLVVLNSVYWHNYKLPNIESFNSRCASILTYNLQIDHIQVLLQFWLMMTSKCISKLTQSWGSGSSPLFSDYGLEVDTIMTSKSVSKFAWSQSAGASVYSLDLGCQVHPQTRVTAASKCSSECSWLQPCGATLSSHDYSVVNWQGHKEESLLSTLYCTYHGI